MDPIRSAADFSDAQTVLDWVVRDLSIASPRTDFLGCIYRSYPALEMSLSSACKGGQLVDVRGLHEAFCQSPTFFDRWVVESRQRNRWQDYTQIEIPGPLKQFWKLKTFHSFRRVVLCTGSRPIAYLSASLPSGSTWTHEELAAIDARYRKSSNALRLAAIAWRARHSPEDRATRLLKGKQAVVILGENGVVLSCSPEARKWLPRDAELNAFVTQLGQSDSDRGKQRLRRFDVDFSEESSALHTPWKVIRLSPTREPVPTGLSDDLEGDLSPRELELCEWLVMGHGNASIAEQMGVKPSTVKTMLERLYERREVRGRVELVKQLLTPQ